MPLFNFFLLSICVNSPKNNYLSGKRIIFISLKQALFFVSLAQLYGKEEKTFKTN